MRTTIMLLALVFFASTQASAERKPRPHSPEIHEDGRVTFRLRAPNAESVVVDGQWSEESISMQKNDQGIWSVTVDSPPKGIWEYRFEVDGLSMIDPENSAIKPMRSPRTSILHLPSDPPAVHDFQDVPHGTVRHHDYLSASLNRRRSYVVYTPPDYGTSGSRTYPLLVLQHGSGDNERTWTVHGKAHWILDNLIANGKAVPMVVLMMDGHAVSPRKSRKERKRNTAMFERDLLQDVLPRVESDYRVAENANRRGIVGLSMGGEQSLTIGLRHSDRFAWIGGFSSGRPKTEAIADALGNPTAINERLKLLWIACGEDDFVLERNQAFLAELNESGIDHDWELTEGDHSWPVWRGYLARFLPLLFAEESD